MNKRIFALGLMALVLSIATAMDASAQGRGHGGGNGGGNSGGMGGGRSTMGGPPAGVGVDRGLGTASTRSGGRSDNGLGNASTRSNGRSDAGLAHARAASVSDTDLNRYRGLSRKLGTTPEEMRARYEAALLANPNLKYGQFVAANVVADNLSRRNPAVTSSAILSGLASGDSLGETLRNLGLSKDQAKDAQRDAEDRIKSAKSRH
ncbi:MAG: hypothetical protein ACR2IH_02165 [Pyrinomonadaceae bacterium]